MTTELTKAAQQALEALTELLPDKKDPNHGGHDARDVRKWHALVERLRALTQRPAAQEVDDGDITGQPGPLPETGWDEVPEGAFRKPSPTAGMNLGERIKHVGGRENAAGYIEFGSVMAVRALVRQYLRDLPAPQQATPVQDGTRSPHDGEPMSARKAAYFMQRFRREEKLLGPNEQLAIDFVLALLEGPAATPEPVGEPVGTVVHAKLNGQAKPWVTVALNQDADLPDGAKLFTHPAPGVPEGFALVPVEPTAEMMEAMPSLPAIGAPGDMELKAKGWSLKAIQNRHRWLAALAAAQAKGAGQ